MADEANVDQGNTGTGSDSGTSSFLDSMSEGMRDNALFEGVESSDALGQKHIDLNTSYEELRSQTAVPESVDDYAFEAPEGISIDETEQTAFKEWCKGKGFTQAHYADLMEFETSRIAAGGKADKEKHDASIAALKQEFGGKYDEALARADKALQASGFGKELLQSEDPAEMKKILADSPMLFKVFNWIGTAISQDNLIPGSAGNVGDTRGRNEDGSPQLDYGDDHK